jgi:hypothetical protein
MLPQRRKSAEEIAKLRESMGIPGAVDPAAQPAAPAGDAAVADQVAAAPLAAGPAMVPPLTEALPPAAAKPVRSLRKSERQVVARKVPVAASGVAGIPVRRRGDDELIEMRRIQATPPDKSIAHIQQLAMPWPAVALGYLLPLCGAICAWFAAWSPAVPPLDFPAEWIADLSRQPWLAKAGLGALGLFGGSAFALAGWFALKKPRSRHHAGFISIITLLVLVFGILQLTSTHGP